MGWRNKGSLESRTGTWALFSASALIHFPRALNDRLIDLASSKVCPSLPVERTNINKRQHAGESIGLESKTDQKTITKIRFTIHPNQCIFFTSQHA